MIRRHPRLGLAAVLVAGAVAAGIPSSAATSPGVLPNTASPPSAEASRQATRAITRSAPPSGLRLHSVRPVRAAFYYPWFPEAWEQQGFDPFTRYSPDLGRYSSGSARVISRHVSEMIYAGLDAGISSWWGPRDPTDRRVPALLAGASGRPFRWTLYYEREGISDPEPGAIARDLRYVAAHYARHPSYLRVGGRPVIFVYADADDGCGMAGRWRRANARTDFYVVLKDFQGYRRCPAKPASWHQYAPAQAREVSTTSFTVSPGFWRPDEATPRLSRDRTGFTSDLAAMVASGKRWQLITTWNEWGEGTAVEAAEEWATDTGHGWYVDAMHAALYARPQQSFPAVGEGAQSVP